MKYVTLGIAAAVLIMLGSLVPAALAATKSEAWNAGYHDAYYWIYGGHMKPQKSHSQAYIDGFEAGLQARRQPVQQPGSSSSSSSSSSSVTNNNNIIINPPAPAPYYQPPSVGGGGGSSSSSSSSSSSGR